MMKTSSDIKMQVVQVYETLYQRGDMALKKSQAVLWLKRQRLSCLILMNGEKSNIEWNLRR